MDDRSVGRKRITIKDIARISGYSKTAVSFAFNNQTRLSVAACTKIQSVATELGYYPDPLARNFSLQRHKSIGFLLPQDIHYSLRNPYIIQIIQGVGSICQKYENTLTLIPPINKSIAEAIRCAAVDGLITLGMSMEMEIVDIIRQRNLPFVTIDGIPAPDMPSVNIKDRDAAYEIMRLVLEHGHRNIAIIGLMEVSYDRQTASGIGHLRQDGYVSALQECGLDWSSPNISMYISECTLEESRLIGNRILKQKQLPTCIVSMSDITAIGAMLELSEQGICIPGDISIVGFDNIQESSYVEPSLTTVDQPAGEKGRQSAELLFAVINGIYPEQEHLVISYRILRRQSLAVSRHLDGGELLIREVKQ